MKIKNLLIHKQIKLLKRCYGRSHGIKTISHGDGVPVTEEEINKRLLHPTFKLETFERLKSMSNLKKKILTSVNY